MTTPPDMAYFVGQIEQLDEWLRSLPMTKEYRERTTFRQFHNLVAGKKIELGLTPEVIERLHQVKDNVDLDMAWLAVGMTYDHHELLSEIYYKNLPMSFEWMPEYEPMRRAVEDFTRSQPLYQPIEDEAIREIVRRHVPSPSNTAE